MKLDMARLLMLMLGDDNGRCKYIASRQLPQRDRLDDTKLRSLKVEYWIGVQAEYNDPSNVIYIDTDDHVVDMYLRSAMSSSFRVPWTAPKLREQFRQLRSDYEGSEEKRHYDQSGQNGPLFYPDFQRKNPAHVLLHYLLREMPEGGVLGDMPEDCRVDTHDGEEDVDVYDADDGDGEEDGENEEKYIDLQSEDEESEEVVAAPVPAQTPPPRPRRKRRRHQLRSASPASNSSGSSLATDATRQRNAYAVKAASETIQTACSSLVSSFADIRKTVLQKKKADSLDRSERALRLVLTKAKIVSTIKALQASGADEQDILLLQKNLAAVKKDIADSL